MLAGAEAEQSGFVGRELTLEFGHLRDTPPSGEAAASVDRGSPLDPAAPAVRTLVDQDMVKGIPQQGRLVHDGLIGTVAGRGKHRRLRCRLGNEAVASTRAARADGL